MLRGRVVLIPFPFDDLSATKVRPAVCLTEPVGPHGHVVVAFITSRIAELPLDSDLVIPEQHPGFAETGLRISSTLRLHRVVTVTTALIKRDLGTLPSSLLTEVERRLRALFAL